MVEREFVERVRWDTKSIIDVAIDTTVEVLRTEGPIGHEVATDVGRYFKYIRKNPHRNLSIIAPDGKTLLISYIPPLEFAINGNNLDEGELSNEARLVTFNPYKLIDAPDYLKKQMEIILSGRLANISNAYRLKHDGLMVTFPREHFATNIERYNVPVLG